MPKFSLKDQLQKPKSRVPANSHQVKDGSSSVASVPLEGRRSSSASLLLREIDVSNAKDRGSASLILKDRRSSSASVRQETKDSTAKDHGSVETPKESCQTDSRAPASSHQVKGRSSSFTRLRLKDRRVRQETNDSTAKDHGLVETPEESCQTDSRAPASSHQVKGRSSSFTRLRLKDRRSSSASLILRQEPDDSNGKDDGSDAGDCFSVKIPCKDFESYLREKKEKKKKQIRNGLLISKKTSRDPILNIPGVQVVPRGNGEKSDSDGIKRISGGTINDTSRLKSISDHNEPPSKPLRRLSLKSKIPEKSLKSKIPRKSSKSKIPEKSLGYRNMFKKDLSCIIEDIAKSK
mmetsp:Transcript_34853/g.80600  ORF Transcript_34853/g.80600 Transcript_34853/m.80600 type:complete len:350 (-) Transcript_34853:185-1234(-)|eukprot:CAMPEP_0113308462 /NCGR_PEP_ID=MMETSP0010_2-20120614/6898_1 /TAXON_ID=216773 ORGANISM="Corethron hystrix, Strain 308" /NCGR_SAMPLE_ID=MMETSP0010_2 /ASSEMBLY_ACC=CAM_ASM_000155 /LENGTH=349 /DNA_ID=CAMNT_0000163523 /DNA_START=59 /DNA_END=1108 /DNA_ORIENTATION=- /assembly_acc=CAM_ASM_000155